MTYTPFNGLPCAYQLHYHFCFQTKFSQPHFSSSESIQCLSTTFRSICDRNKYHLLGHRVDMDKLYCLLSLKPSEVLSDVARKLKSNLAREFNLQTQTAQGRSLWSIGYYVGSVGKASKKAAERYIANQGEHHGIPATDDRETMRWINREPPSLGARHVTFDLSYHVVLVTSGRADVFDRRIAPHLFASMAELAGAGGFYIERMSLLYDHIHLLVKLTPSSRLSDCVEALMNHSWRLMIDRYSGVLKNTGAYNVWTQSYYVSTVGQATTAQVKSFHERSGPLG